MSKLPFDIYDLVKRTEIDHAPEQDAAQGITRDMVGEVAGIDHATPMFSVVFDNGTGDVYLADELVKVGYRVHNWSTGQHTDVMFSDAPRKVNYD